METIKTIYTGNLRTEATHVATGIRIITDAPLDNQGLGQAFSPTDLLSASLGSCMLTLMGIAGRTHGIDIDETKVSITKIMAANPRRVAEIVVELTLPERFYTDKEKAILENAARTCPVAMSLHPDLKQTFLFNYPNA